MNIYKLKHLLVFFLLFICIGKSLSMYSEDVIKTQAVNFCESNAYDKTTILKKIKQDILSTYINEEKFQFFRKVFLFLQEKTPLTKMKLSRKQVLSKIDELKIKHFAWANEDETSKIMHGMAIFSNNFDNLADFEVDDIRFIITLLYKEFS